jgi:hypothetical protein
MEIFTVSELMHLTRRELCDLWDHTQYLLSSFEAGSVARWNALVSLDNIGRVLRLKALRL